MPADNASPNGANETTLNAVQNAVPGMTSDAAPEAPPSAASSADAAELLDEATAEIPDTATEESPGEMAADFSGAAAEELSDAAAEELPGAAAEEPPDAAAAELPSEMADDFPDVATAELPGAATVELPGAASAELPGAATAELPGTAPAGFPGAIQGYSGLDVPNMEAPASIDPEEQAAIRKLEERRAQARRKRITKIAIACGVVAALIGFWLVSGIIQNNAESKNNHPEVTVVQRGELSSSVQASGTLKPSSYVAVTPEVSGVIQDVMVVEGQQVNAGDDLLTISNSELEKALADAGAALDHARQNYNLAESGVSSAWDSYNEAVRKYNEAVDAANRSMDNAHLIADDAYTTAYDAAMADIPASASDEERNTLEELARQNAQAAYDEAYAAAATVDPGTFEHSGYLSAIEAAETSEVSSQQALDDAQRAYDYAVEQAGKRVVKAPESGTVLDLVAVPGAAVGGASGGTSTANEALMQIADLKSFDADVEINEVDIADVKPGQRAVITLSAIPDLELEGTVDSVASVASNSTGENGASSAMAGGVVTFKVTIKVNKPDDQLKPGMSATVKIMTKDVQDALIIPSSAVIGDGDDAYVMVAIDKDATETEMRKIVIADRASTQVSVESGLKEGEIVVSQPLGDESGSAASASASGA